MVAGFSPNWVCFKSQPGWTFLFPKLVSDRLFLLLCFNLNGSPQLQPVFAFFIQWLFCLQSEPDAACVKSQSKPVSVSLSESASPSDQCHVYLLYQWLLLFRQAFSELQFQFVSIRPLSKFVSPCSLPQSVIPLDPVLHHPVPLSQVIRFPSSWWHPDRPGGMFGVCYGDGCITSIFPLFSPLLILLQLCVFSAHFNPMFLFASHAL